MTTNRTIGQLRENARRNGAPGPRVEPTEQWMTLWDGTRLFYRAWLPARPASKALVLFHRGHEHSGRLQDVVERLHLTDVAVFAWDARGHGRSPGARGWAPSFGTLVRDVDSFVHQLTRTYNIPIANMVVMAHSVGAVTVATWVHDYAPGIRALVLATPALRVRLYVPLAIPGLRLLSRLKGRKPAFVQSYVKSRMLTHDENEARRYEEDPLITRAIAVNILLGMYDASTRLLADAGAIRVPTLVLSGGADWVVHLSAQRTFFEQLGSPQKKLCLFPGMYHDVLHEKDNEPVLEEARRFIAEQLAREDQGELLLDADEQGYTRDEYVRLNRPLKPLSLRRWQYRGLELGMKSLGRLSAGIRLGWRSGFDSGRTLDYVYENTARGALGIGVLFDRLYLDGAGWRGIRQRKSLLEKLLRRALGSHVAAGRPVHCVDVAAGPGRYLLETLHRLSAPGISALLRDNQPANLDAGRRLAAKLGLRNVAFETADAFDAESLAALEPAPNVAVVSGLYELFPDNGKVRESLRGLAAALADGGYLVYTNQPWHPQLELIARVLVNRDGAPWVMRRRTQQEMDDLVRARARRPASWAVFGPGSAVCWWVRRRRSCRVTSTVAPPHGPRASAFPSPASSGSRSPLRGAIPPRRGRPGSRCRRFAASCARRWRRWRRLESTHPPGTEPGRASREPVFRAVFDTRIEAASHWVDALTSDGQASMMLA